MTYRVSDFLPFYNAIEDDSFNNGIKSKQEFIEPRIKETENIPIEKGELFAHQVLISRLMSSYTPYDGILLMHEMGTGKTCTASAIIQQIRSENNGIDKFIYVAKNNSLLDNFDDEFRGKCTIDDYTSVKKLGQIGIIKLTHDGFIKEYKSKPPSNCVIIIDEIHNIKGTSKSYNESSTYNDYYKILKSTKNAKTILLSGTPITDKPNEIASVMNLILSIDEQLPTGKEFDTKFIDTNGNINNENDLIKAFSGRISYIKSMQSNVKKVFVGTKADGFKHFITDSSNMSDEQTAGYNTAIKQDEDGLSPAFSNSLQALDIVVNGEFGVNLKPVILKGTTINDKLKDLEKYSSKYAASVRTILKARTEGKSVFVFNKHVVGGGLKTFASILTQCGFTEATRDKINSLTGQSNRFILLTGAGGVDVTKVEKIGGKSTKGWGRDLGIAVKRFNNVDNINGQMIGVVLASEAISEGYSFNNVQVIDIHSPWFNFAKISQVIARGIRVGSHDRLIARQKEKGNNDDIIVDIHLRVSIPSGAQNAKYPGGIDSYTYKTAESKDIIVKKIEHIIKEHSIDSYLARKRNWRDSSMDGTRDCDYTTCAYKSFPGTDIKKNVPIDYSTFEMYYPDNIDDIINEIIDMFTTRYSMRLDDIVRLYNRKLMRPVVRALVSIVNDDIPIKILNGDICFLREQDNIYYLVDTYTNSTTILDMYYVKNKHIPVEYVSDTPSDVNIFSLDNVTTVRNLNFEMRSMTNDQKETVLEANIPNGNKIVLEKFKGLWGEIDGVIYSWFLMTKKGKGRVFDGVNGWSDCDTKSTNIIKDYINKVKQDFSTKAANLFGDDSQPYYGLFDYTDNHADINPYIFSIIKVIDTSGITDKRKLPSGLRCDSFTGFENSHKINYIIEKLSPLTVGMNHNLVKKLSDKCEWIEKAMNSLGLITRDIRI